MSIIDQPSSCIRYEADSQQAWLRDESFIIGLLQTDVNQFCDICSSTSVPRPWNQASHGGSEANRRTVSLNIPEELYRQAREIADSQHLSIDDVISSRFAEQLAARDRLKQRATRGNRESFLRALDKVPDVAPEVYDQH